MFKILGIKIKGFIEKSETLILQIKQYIESPLKHALKNFD